MAGSTPEVSLRITAQDGASDVMRKIQAQLSSTSASVGSFNQKVGTEGVAGLGKLSSGFEHLARSALGFGRAEASIAVGAAEAFGATLPVLLAVSAAIGLAVEAWKLFEEPIRKAREATDKFIESQDKAARSRANANVELEDQVAVQQKHLDYLNKEIEALERENNQVVSSGGGDVVTIDNTKEINRLREEQTNLTRALTEAKVELKAKGDALILSLVMEGNATQFGALAAKRMEIAMTPGLSDAQIKAADAALVHNEALKEQKKHLDGLVYGMGKYAKELEDLVDRLARPAGTPNLGDPLNQGPLPPILRGATPQEHDSGLMRGHAGDPTFGYTQQDIALIGDANAGLSALSGTMQTVQDLLPTIADGFAMVFEQLGSGGFDAAAKSFGKFIGQLAAMEGKLLILEGLGKIAKGLFPPIPALLTSGIKMVAAGAALEVFAGSLGGGAGGTSGGTGAGGGTTAPNQSSQPLPSKGTLTISVPRHAYSGWSDPGFQEFIAQTIAGASGRGVRMVTR